MNCERFKTVVRDLAAPSAWSMDETPVGHSVEVSEAADRAATLQHAAICHDCAASLEDERSLTMSLRTMAQDMSGVSAPTRLEEKLLAAFRERSRLTPVVVPFPSQSRQTRNWVAAIAAALLIVFGVLAVRGFVFSRRPEPQVASDNSKPKEAAAVVPDVKPQTPVAVTTKGTQESLPPTPKLPAPQRKRAGNYLAASRPTNATKATPIANTQSVQDNVEVATDFFPIGYSSTPNLQEGGQLLRVELSRAAVARFGLPVNMDRAGERVKADVLVGADGLAQAIRFVH